MNPTNNAALAGVATSTEDRREQMINRYSNVLEDTLDQILRDLTDPRERLLAMNHAIGVTARRLALLIGEEFPED